MTTFFQYFMDFFLTDLHFYFADILFFILITFYLLQILHHNKTNPITVNHLSPKSFTTDHLFLSDNMINAKRQRHLLYFFFFSDILVFFIWFFLVFLQFDLELAEINSSFSFSIDPTIFNTGFTSRLIAIYTAFESIVFLKLTKIFIIALLLFLLISFQNQQKQPVHQNVFDYDVNFFRPFVRFLVNFLFSLFRLFKFFSIKPYYIYFKQYILFFFKKTTLRPTVSSSITTQNNLPGHVPQLFFLNVQQTSHLQFSLTGEAFFLLSLSLLALFSLLYSKNLLTVYLSLELYGIAAYTLTGYSKNLKALRASGKYFIVGSVGSFLILFSIVLCYENHGHLDFELLQRSFLYTDLSSNTLTTNSYTFNLFTNISNFLPFFLFFLGIFLKLGLAPLHTWLVEIYDNTAFFFFSYFLTIPKIIIFVFFVKYLYFITSGMLHQHFSDFLYFLAVINIVIGTFVPLGKRNLKQLLTLSSLSNFGYALLSISFFSIELSFSSIVFYFIYNALTISLLTTLFQLQSRYFVYVHSSLYNLKYFSFADKLYITSLIFSLNGLPPFSLFFGKFFLIVSLVQVQAYFSCFLVLLFSAISSYYYLKLLQVILIDVKTDKLNMRSLFKFFFNHRHYFFFNQGYLLQFMLLLPIIAVIIPTAF